MEHREREKVFYKTTRERKGRKLHDPRLPPKSKIIKKHLHLLHLNPNKKKFPNRMLIAADRRRKNLRELYKPSTPSRTFTLATTKQPGFWRCNRRCDTCAHSKEVTTITSPWDNRRWSIRQHLTCTTQNVVYVLQCELHPDSLYVGSTTNLKLRWANHKSDIKLRKVTKCRVAHHVATSIHPNDANLRFLKIFPVETVTTEDRLLDRELFWQANLGTVFNGLNHRRDLEMAKQQRIQYRV